MPHKRLFLNALAVALTLAAAARCCPGQVTGGESSSLALSAAAASTALAAPGAAAPSTVSARPTAGWLSLHGTEDLYAPGAGLSSAGLSAALAGSPDMAEGSISRGDSPIEGAPNTRNDLPAARDGSPGSRPREPMSGHDRPFSRVGFGAKAGTLGLGFEVATPLAPRTNLRVAGNFIKYSHNGVENGFLYTANLGLSSVVTSVDWFPFRGGFHISPGFYFHGGNNVAGHTAVAGGQSFTLNDTVYVSSAADPINGSGKAVVNNSGPLLTVGWGNLLPRHRHFSFPFEVGAAYHGDPKISVHLGGSACDSTGVYCQPATSFPDFNQNLADEVTKLDKDASPYKFYPILSFGFGVNF